MFFYTLIIKLGIEMHRMLLMAEENLFVQTFKAIGSILSPKPNRIDER